MTVFRGITASVLIPRAPVVPCGNQTVLVTTKFKCGGAACVHVPRALIFPGVYETVQRST